MFRKQHHKSLFQTIYRLAKKRNEVRLIELIYSGANINTIENKYTPVMLLAKEGDEGAVEWLLNKFQADIHSAVSGYTRGRHYDKMENLLARGASLQAALIGHPQIKDYDKEGVNGNFLILIEILSQVKNTALRRHLARIAAQEVSKKPYRGFNEKRYFEALIELSSKPENMFQTICRLAREGDEKGLTELIKSGIDIHKGEAPYSSPAMLLAEEGNEKAVELLFNKFNAHITCIIAGYAHGGHHDQVENLLYQNNFDKVLVTRAAENYVKSRYYHKLENLFSNGATLLTVLVNYRERKTYNAQGGAYADTAAIVHILSFVSTPQLRINLLKEVTDGLRKYGLSFDAEKIFRITEKQNQLMNKYQFSYEETLKFIELLKENDSPKEKASGFLVWFLQGIQLVQERRLSAEIFLHISAYLTGMGDKNILQFYMQTSFTSCKQFLVDDLARAAQTSWFGLNLFSPQRIYAERCLKTIREENNIEGVLEFLDSQDKESDFYTSLERHEKRFASI